MQINQSFQSEMNAFINNNKTLVIGTLGIALAVKAVSSLAGRLVRVILEPSNHSKNISDKAQGVLKAENTEKSVSMNQDSHKITSLSTSELNANPASDQLLNAKAPLAPSLFASKIYNDGSSHSESNPQLIPGKAESKVASPLTHPTGVSITDTSIHAPKLSESSKASEESPTFFEPKMLKDSGIATVKLEWDATAKQPVIVKQYTGIWGKFLASEAKLLKVAKEHGISVPLILKEESSLNGTYTISTNYFQSIPITNKEELESIPLQDRFKIIQDLVKEVTMLHKIGIAHNDLNITNILFDGKKVHIIDFGAAAESNDIEQDMNDIARLMVNMLALKFTEPNDHKHPFGYTEELANSLKEIGIDPNNIVKAFKLIESNSISAEEFLSHLNIKTD